MMSEAMMSEVGAVGGRGLSLETAGRDEAQR
jgi:hypothetical protein